MSVLQNVKVYWADGAERTWIGVRVEWNYRAEGGALTMLDGESRMETTVHPAGCEMIEITLHTPKPSDE